MVKWENEGMGTGKRGRIMGCEQASGRQWALKGALLSDLLTTL
jgi:hypothetical protein